VPVKTFAVGELVSATDVNTYMANPGLDYVKSQTIGTAVSSVEVTAAFSSTYDAYVVVLAGGTSSGSPNIRMTLGASAASYYSGYIQVTYSTGAVAGGAVNNGAYWDLGGARAGNPSLIIELENPNLARPTSVRSFDATTVTYRQYGGYHNVSTAYTAFTLTPSTGTLTGGTIIVYGHRKA
jgi:hypothetical protein